MKISIKVSFNFFLEKKNKLIKKIIIIGIKEPMNNNWIPVPKADKVEILKTIKNLFLKLKFLTVYFIK